MATWLWGIMERSFVYYRELIKETTSKLTDISQLPAMHTQGEFMLIDAYSKRLELSKEIINKLINHTRE